MNRPTISGARRAFASDNEECARIILKNIAANGGEGSLSVLHARRVLGIADSRAQDGRGASGTPETVLGDLPAGQGPCSAPDAEEMPDA